MHGKWIIVTKWLEGLVLNQDLRLAKAGFATRSFGSYVTVKKCNLIIGDKVSVASEGSVQGIMEDYQESMTYDALDFLKNMVMYEEVKTKKSSPFVSLSANENYLGSQEEREEYLALQKTQPDLTQKGYSVYKTMQRAMSVSSNKQYNEYYKKALGVIKGGTTMSREAVLVMRHVDFDRDGQPLTKKDQENHKWNMDWLKAIDEDDFEQREKILAEEVPKRFWIKDLQKPSEMLVSLHRKMKGANNKKGKSKTWDEQRIEKEYREEFTRFQKKLERYAEEKLEQKDYAFFEEMRIALSLDALMDTHPSLKQYWSNNRELAKRNEMVGAFGTLCGNYITKTYLVKSSASATILTGKDQLIRANMENAQLAEDLETTDFLDKYLQYQEVKDEPYVPYRTIIREEDRKKKEKRAAVRQNKQKYLKDREDFLKEYGKI